MTTPSSLPHRADIQGLRALAILLVVLAHAGVPLFSGGFVGVDVFFVLSGYLITGLLLREYEASQTIRFGGFFSRRLKRLLPSLLTMLCLVISVAPFMLTQYEIAAQSGSAGFAVTWTSNVFFALSDLDYFAELQARDLFLHTWSLGVEEQFYLIWPILLLATLKPLSRYLPAGSFHKQLLIVLGLLFAGSLTLCWYWAATEPRWSFYLMPSRIWQFSLGAGVFVWLNRHHDESTGSGMARPLGIVCGALGLILIAGSAMLLHPNVVYPGFWALLPSLGAAMTIGAGHGNPERGIGKMLGHPVLVWVGDRSYSLYLWHWPVLMLGFAWGMHRHPLYTLVLVMMSLILAILSYRLVEQPFWKGRLSHATPCRTLLLSALAMLVVIVGSQSYLNPTLATDTAQPKERAIAGATAPNASIVLKARSDLPALYAMDCDTWYRDSSVSPCLYGDKKSPKTAVLFGDSVGTQWFSLLPEMYPEPEWRIVILTKSGCPMVDEDYYYERIKQTYTVCTEWRNGALDFLKSLKPEVVFLGSASGYPFSEGQWTEGTARILERLTAAAKQVVVIPGTPHLSFDGPLCLERHRNSAPGAAGDGDACREALASVQVVNVTGYLERAVQRFPNARLLDLNDLVCPQGICAARDGDGRVVFRDDKHLTDSFVRSQIPAAAARLQSLGLGQTWANYTSRAEDHHGH